MFDLLIVTGCALIIAAMWVAFIAANASEGWQDSDGFHHGRKPDDLED